MPSAFESKWYSFIARIYIAPLQGYFSEALPTLARLNRAVLQDMSMKDTSTYRIDKFSLQQ